MELKDFVKNVVISVEDGLSELKNDGKTYNLARRDDVNTPNGKSGVIDFDLAITVTETSNSGVGGKLGISIASISADAKEKNSVKNENRIKFTLMKR
jgi:hypothetical protein